LQVTNIDYSGNEINHGQIEITDTDLIMHYASEKSSLLCPLSTIRRYGYEDFMFCFEAGRLSPYGQGIFAFRSKDADKIFNVIKQNLLVSLVLIFIFSMKQMFLFSIFFKFYSHIMII